MAESTTRNGRTVDPEAWYAAKEAADLLGVVKQTVVRYCKREVIHPDHCRKQGPTKMWYVKGAAIQKVLTDWSVDPLPEVADPNRR